VLVHYDLGSAKTVLFADARGLALASAATGIDETDEFRIQYSADDATWTDCGPAFDAVSTTAINRRRRAGTGIAGVSARYWRVAKVGGADLSTTKAEIGEFWLWSSAGTLSNGRVIPFKFSDVQRYVLVATDYNIAVYKDGVRQADIYSPYLSDELYFINWTQSLDTLLTFHEDIQMRKIQRQGAHDEWNDEPLALSNIPQYDFGAGDEDQWSATRGWPRCGTFYQGRLWLGGSAERPATVASSKSGDFFNFDVGTGAADEAINYTLEADGVSSIYNLRSGRHLQALTADREYYALPNDAVMTPENVIWNAGTEVGSEGPGLRAGGVEGATIFIQDGGKAARELIYNDVEIAYVADNISLLSSHLLSGPVDFAIRKGTSTDDSSLVLVVNGDGSLAVLATLRKQEVTEWFLHHTDGSFLAVGSDGPDVTFVVERVINEQTVRLLEMWDDSHYSDCSFRFTSGLPTDTFGGMDILDGATVRVRADGAILDSETVASGSVTISRDAATSVEIGLDFPDVQELEVDRLVAGGLTERMARKTVFGSETAVGQGFGVWVRDMPVEPNLPDGTYVGRLKRIIEAHAPIYRTQAFWFRANGGRWVETTFRKFGAGLLDEPPPTVTDVWTVRGLLGVTHRGQCEFAQKDPVPFTLQAIVKEVAL